ncbi:hypothetical protein BXZ70DRAFT_912336 [Cristinia sonorae]|uniref:Uncharacterized protein n=1 Tax=Cristinia sonorae TaxID=1940300 RepID=A0A8K0V132_9AGAR|nr:hypothetical protein BXZ70DRAFT_912336 [Cristinia sonorae]
MSARFPISHLGRYQTQTHCCHGSTSLRIGDAANFSLGSTSCKKSLNIPVPDSLRDLRWGKFFWRDQQNRLQRRVFGVICYVPVICQIGPHHSLKNDLLDSGSQMGDGYFQTHRVERSSIRTRNSSAILRNHEDTVFPYFKCPRCYLYSIVSMTHISNRSGNPPNSVGRFLRACNSCIIVMWLTVMEPRPMYPKMSHPIARKRIRNWKGP